MLAARAVHATTPRGRVLAWGASSSFEEDTTFWLWAFARRFGASYIPETLHGSDSFQAAVKGMW